MAGPKPLTDDELQAALSTSVDDAIQYCEEEVGKDREKATRYYRGDISQDLPDIAGRSRVVSRDVRDVVLQILPSIMRVFFGTQKVVEFDPVGIEDEEGAKQATDYVKNVVLGSDNDGPSIFYSAFKDALVRRTGVVKVYWKSETSVSAERFAGISPDLFAVFSAEAEASAQVQEITDVEQDEKGFLSFVVKTRKTSGKVCIEPVPPEEFVISRDAKDDVRPPLIGTRSMLTVSDLVAMGYDFDEMLELAGDSDDPEYTGESDARRFTSDVFDDEDGGTDPALRKVEYIEVYKLIDADGDGIAEMRKVCLAGPGRKLLRHEIVADHPFATFCPEPEPHTFFGLSVADSLMDVQIIRSQLMRLMLDGLNSVVTPRQKYLRGKVDLKQLADARPGGLVGVDQMDAVLPLETDKSAPQLAMQAYELMGQVRQDRTGQNQASMGLQPDALQSVSRIAANELVQTAQSRVEMICRHFASGMRRVFRLVLDNITRYQDSERTIRLRGRWVSMDPRQWNPSMDVVINVGLGKGNVEERTAFLQQFLQVQQAVMQQAGPQNPWFNEEKIRNALEDVCEAAGNMAERYVLTSQEWEEVRQQQAANPPPPQPSPVDELVQVETAKIQAKAQADAETTRLKAGFESQSRAEELQLQREKLAQDARLKEAELQREYEYKMAALAEEMRVKMRQAEIQIELKRAESAPIVESNQGVAEAVAQVATVQAAQQTQVLGAILNAVAAPKQVVRDDQGRIVGVQTVTS